MQRIEQPNKFKFGSARRKQPAVVRYFASGEGERAAAAVNTSNRKDRGSCRGGFETRPYKPRDLCVTPRAALSSSRTASKTRGRRDFAAPRNFGRLRRSVP